MQRNKFKYLQSEINNVLNLERGATLAELAKVKRLTRVVSKDKELAKKHIEEQMKKYQGGRPQMRIMIGKRNLPKSFERTQRVPVIGKKQTIKGNYVYNGKEKSTVTITLFDKEPKYEEVLYGVDQDRKWRTKKKGSRLVKKLISPLFVEEEYLDIVTKQVKIRTIRTGNKSVIYFDNKPCVRVGWKTVERKVTKPEKVRYKLIFHNELTPQPQRELGRIKISKIAESMRKIPLSAK